METVYTLRADLVTCLKNFTNVASLSADGINFYNFGWEDHQTTNFNVLIKVLKSLDFLLQTGKKVAVHCHAGIGRTGLVIACYLVFSLNLTGQQAIDLFKLKRKGGLSNRTQRNTIISFEKCTYSN